MVKLSSAPPKQARRDQFVQQTLIQESRFSSRRSSSDRHATSGNLSLLEDEIEGRASEIYDLSNSPITV